MAFDINMLTDADLENGVKQDSVVSSRGMANGLTPQTDAPPLDELERLGIKELWGKSANKAPAYVNKKEKYEHRVIAHLKACCKTNVEIARLTGFSPVTINYLVRQPFMEAMILGEIRQNADPALALLANAALDSAQRLIDIAINSENDETRRKANNDILDRKYGKPNQPMTVKDVSPSELSDAELVKYLGDNHNGSAHSN